MALKAKRYRGLRQIEVDSVFLGRAEGLRGSNEFPIAKT